MMRPDLGLRQRALADNPMQIALFGEHRQRAAGATGRVSHRLRGAAEQFAG
jgi:hypothetical protein